MKILALEKEVPRVSDIQFTSDLLQSEARKAWELNTGNVIRELYFSADKHHAVLILECDAVEEAHRCLACLPLVQTRPHRVQPGSTRAL